jgi:hypothetical protein
MAPRSPARPLRARLVSSLLFFLLVWGIPSLAQENAASQLSIGAGRLYTTEGWELAFSKFTLLDPDSASYQVAGEPAPRLVPVSTLLRVQEQTGHEGRRSALVGGACGLVGGALGFWLADSAVHGMFGWLDAAGGYGSSSSDEESNVGAAVAAVSASTLIGALVGYREGTRQRSYSTVYEDPSLKRP